MQNILENIQSIQMSISILMLIWTIPTVVLLDKYGYDDHLEKPVKTALIIYALIVLAWIIAMLIDVFT